MSDYYDQDESMSNDAHRDIHYLATSPLFYGWVPCSACTS